MKGNGQIGRSGCNRLRIIGGSLRRQYLHFSPKRGLRPTNERVRETLYNWLQRDVEQARCLDLFAGSGALGIEAISRGATFCQFVEHNRNTCMFLVKQLERLGISQCTKVFCMDAARFLGKTDEAFDIVFVDPPFHEGESLHALAAMRHYAFLDKIRFLYAETSCHEKFTPPCGWEKFKQGKVGDVAFYLLVRGDN